MKAIISGFRYDTAKAQLVGEASVGYAGDFTAWHAGLYRTPRAGNFFLAGSGGPLTKFARRADGGGMQGSDKIIPLTAEDAYHWAERYLDAQTIEEYFGEMVKDA